MDGGTIKLINKITALLLRDKLLLPQLEIVLTSDNDELKEGTISTR